LARPGRQAQTEGETYSMIGMSGAAIRTKRAIHNVNVGLSMTTRTSGRSATTARTVA
jgi:hypothetical protein